MAQQISVELNLIDHLTKNVAAVQAQLTGHFRKMEEAAGKTKRSFEGNQSAAIGLRHAYTALAGIAGGVFVKSIFESALQMEKFQRVMEFATGSAEAGKQEFAFVRGEVDRLGLNLNKAAGDFGKLSAAANGTSLAGQATKDIFVAVSEASTVLGLTADETSGALMAIQQMISKGTVQAEELRGQLGERLPGAFQMAARAMGVTTQQLGKMLEQGQVTASDFLPKLAAELHKTYGTAAVKAADQGRAAINRFSTTVFEAKAQLGDALLPALTRTLGAFTKTMESAVANGSFKKFGDQIGIAAVTGRDLFIVFAGFKIAAIASGFTAASFAASAFGRSLAFIAKNPVFITLAGLAVGIDLITNKFDKAAEKMGDTKWLGDTGQVEKAKGALDQYHQRLSKIAELQEKRKNEKMSDIFSGPDFGIKIKEQEKSIKELDKQFKDITGRTLSDFETTYGKKFLDTQLNALNKLKAKDTAPPPPPPPGESEAQKKARAEKEKFEDEVAHNSLARQMKFEKAKKDRGLLIMDQAFESAQKHQGQMVALEDLQVNAISNAQERELAVFDLAQKRKQEIAAAEISDAQLREKTLLAISQAGERERAEMVKRQEAENRDGMAAGTRESIQGYNEKLTAAQGYATGLAALAATGNMKDREARVRWKMMAGVEAGVNAGRAILQTIADPTLPWYLKIPTAFAIGATAYGEVNKIKGAKFKGGGFTGSGRDDDEAGTVHKNEFVFDAPATRRFGRGNLERMRQGGGVGGSGSVSVGGMTVVIQGNPDSGAMQQLEDAGNRFVDKVVGAINAARDQGHPQMPRLA